MKDRNISYEDIEEDYVITSKPTYLELEQEIARLKKEINTYENPDDLTLMFMWCDEKAKDKIKEQTLEIASLIFLLLYLFFEYHFSIFQM